MVHSFAVFATNARIHHMDNKNYYGILFCSGLCMTSSSTTTQSTVDLKIQEFSKHTDTSTAPPVLLLKGLLGSKRNFSTIGASLAAQLLKKRRIVGVDLRNHGENTHDWRDGMSYQEMALGRLATCCPNGMDSMS